MGGGQVTSGEARVEYSYKFRLLEPPRARYPRGAGPVSGSGSGSPGHRASPRAGWPVQTGSSCWGGNPRAWLVSALQRASSEYEILFTDMFVASNGNLIFVVEESDKEIVLIHFTGRPKTACCCVVVIVAFASEIISGISTS